MARTKKMTALTSAISNLDNRIMSGTASASTKINDYFNKNIGDTTFRKGLENTRKRLAAVSGSPITSKTNLRDIFRITVESRINDTSNLRKGELRTAIDKTLKADVFRGQQGIDNWLGTWKREMGESQPTFNGGKLAGRTAASAGWKQFQKDTGWKGSKTDYENLEFDSFNDWMIYTDNNGTKWRLWFTDSPKQAEYEIL